MHLHKVINEFCLIIRECNWGGGMSAEMCSLVTIDEDRKFEDLIRDKTNPGKRSVPQLDPQVQR